jgi:hypothetical protein
MVRAWGVRIGVSLGHELKRIERGIVADDPTKVQARSHSALIESVKRQTARPLIFLDQGMFSLGWSQ